MENKYVVAGQASSGGMLIWLSNLDLASWSYIVGILVALIGLMGGAYWQWKKDKRDAEMHKAILESIKTRGVNVDEHVD